MIAISLPVDSFSDFVDILARLKIQQSSSSEFSPPNFLSLLISPSFYFYQLRHSAPLRALTHCHDLNVTYLITFLPP